MIPFRVGRKAVATVPRQEPRSLGLKPNICKPPKPCAAAVSRFAAALFTNYLHSRYAAFAIMERRFR